MKRWARLVDGYSREYRARSRVTASVCGRVTAIHHAPPAFHGLPTRWKFMIQLTSQVLP
jgi:hypothetical protein